MVIACPPVRTAIVTSLHADGGTAAIDALATFFASFEEGAKQGSNPDFEATTSVTISIAPRLSLSSNCSSNRPNFTVKMAAGNPALRH